MKTLSIKQPWASAIVAGAKRVENRTWSTAYRGPLLIHASMKSDPAGAEILRAAGVDVPEDAPRGALIGIVDLVDVVELAPRLFGDNLADDPLATGPFCWILANPRPLPEPIEYKGQLSLYDVPDELVEGSPPVA